jgi:tetratricopeptide (TPR) repeat protein
MGLALESAEKPDAAIGEFQEALRIKPDYAVVHYDLGILYYHRQSYDEAIAEYKRAIALEPGNGDAHDNLGLAYKHKGDVASAIPEFRQAKQLKPNDPAIRQNLASALMEGSPLEAIKELRELEQKFPDFAVCHICLGRALAWQGDQKGAEEEFRKAGAADPGAPDGHRELGEMQEKQQNYDAALEQYRAAAKIDPEDADTHKDIGRVLLAKKDYPGALEELKKAERLAQSSWEIHDLYGQALEANGQIDLAIGEFKEAVALNPAKGYAMMHLGTGLEKKGDWPAALDQYRKAVLADSAIKHKAEAGQSYEICGDECTNQYTAAQARFKDYLASLKSSGHAADADDLQKKVAQLENSAGTEEKVEMAIKAGDKAFQGRRMEEAEKSYKEAVELAKNLPPGNDSLIAALGGLGMIYGTRQDFTDASATLHQQLELIEKKYGPGTTQSVKPLQYLAMVSAWQKNYTEAESYLQKALEINSKMAGDNDPRAVESLRQLAGLYMTENDYPKAETYLLRAVKGAEASNDQMLLFPLWGLCDMYDRWAKPDKSQPCWHRATEVMEKQFGQQSPKLADSLTKEANALRKMGKTEEAQKVEERVTNIKRASQN